MKFKDLPNTNISVKLSMVSFSSPKKNLEVFKFIQSLEPHQKFRDIEMDKLLKKYGEPIFDKPGFFQFKKKENADAYNKSVYELLNMDMDNIYPLSLSIEDFNDDICSYPNDKSFWLNANDIKVILDFSTKLKIEIENKKG